MGAGNDEENRETMYSYQEGGGMAKANTKGSKSKVPSMKEIRESAGLKPRKVYPQQPTMRTDTQNIDALKKIRDCLEIRHEKDMGELHINNLSIDDALTYVLVRFSQDHREVADILNLDSKMIKIMKYSGSA
jgi:hypothetical protein